MCSFGKTSNVGDWFFLGLISRNLNKNSILYVEVVPRTKKEPVKVFDRTLVRLRSHLPLVWPGRTLIQPKKTIEANIQRLVCFESSPTRDANYIVKVLRWRRSPVEEDEKTIQDKPRNLQDPGYMANQRQFGGSLSPLVSKLKTSLFNSISILYER